MIAEVVPVETVRPGDEIVVGKLGLHIVAAVNRYETLGLQERRCYVVTYFAHAVETYENRARDSSGRNTRARLVEQSLIPVPAGDLVAVVRGSRRRAVSLRAELARGDAERAAAQANRWARQAQS